MSKYELRLTRPNVHGVTPGEQVRHYYVKNRDKDDTYRCDEPVLPGVTASMKDQSLTLMQRTSVRGLPGRDKSGSSLMLPSTQELKDGQPQPDRYLASDLRDRIHALLSTHTQCDREFVCA